MRGKPSGGLVDIDLDSKQAIFLAPYFLRKTRRVHGRKSKPRSHFWFRVTPTPTPQKFSDVDGTSLVELRSTGQQTIAPPSLHPSGELVRWFAKGRSGRVKEAELLSAVKRLAAATLISRHWPSPGSRNDAALGPPHLPILALVPRREPLPAAVSVLVLQFGPPW